MLAANKIVLTPEEEKKIEITDFGLGNLENEGLQIVVYENNESYCAKELVLLPNQVCSEHKHPHRGNQPGKMETFRCLFGQVWLFVEGETLNETNRFLKNVDSNYFKAGKSIHLLPGDQYTIQPDTFHWFVSGEKGAIVSEFSTPSDDATDIFRNPSIVRT